MCVCGCIVKIRKKKNREAEEVSRLAVLTYPLGFWGVRNPTKLVRTKRFKVTWQYWPKNFPPTALETLDAVL